MVMDKKCPACGKLALRKNPYDSRCLPLYTCYECRWACNPHVTRILARLGRSMEPEVVYLVGLFTPPTPVELYMNQLLDHGHFSPQKRKTK